VVRRAFTLIELIFAIVIMSITVISLPLVMGVDTKARDRNVAQEAVLAASAKLAQVLTYQWDERSLSWIDLAENHQTTARILDDTNFSTTAFDRNGTNSIYRQSGGHRHFFDNVETGIFRVSATAIGDDNVSVVGMDEQSIIYATGSGFQAGFSAAAAGYKKNYQMKVEILRINDARGPVGGVVDYTQTDLTGANRFIFSQTDVGGQTNLRCAKVTIQDGSGNDITTLYGYSANIGEYVVSSRIH
jgi:prepilin-type N-terminal cleavage/methylation domain-containing protein